MATMKTAARFPLGDVYATPGVIVQVPDAEARAALKRHAAGDWGDELCQEDRNANDEALRDGLRLLSSYKTAAETKFWIITEADRSATTLLLPEEY